MNPEPLSLNINIVAGDAVLEGALDYPGNATGLVIFTHGSRSSWFNPRNRYVAGQFHTAGLGTLPFDLLSAEEASHISCRFDVTLLTRRLRRATHVVGSVARERSLRPGYFGTSTDTTAAILVTPELDDTRAIETVASRSDRPGLASRRALARLAYPILLIIGAVDLDVLDLNR